MNHEKAGLESAFSILPLNLRTDYPLHYAPLAYNAYTNIQRFPIKELEVLMNIAAVTRTSRIIAGHPWIFSNELAASPKGFAPGSLVEIQDKKNTFMGIGYVNPHSLIAIRILTRVKEAIDKAFFIRRLEKAVEYRARFAPGREAHRAVFSESDGLPGLIVDKYDDSLCVQFTTLGMEALADLVIPALTEVFSPSTIVLRNDSSIRTLEGLALEKKILLGAPDKLPIINDSGALLEVDLLEGQKTGFFLDQTMNRAAFAAYTSGGSALDLFSYTGAWAMHLALKGSDVTGVDSSQTAITRAKQNAKLNKLESKASFVCEDVFEYVKKDLAARKSYNSIVLDPPAFVKSKARINEAVRAYRDINATCMKMTKHGGLLATSSCSYHIDRAVFTEILRDAARDAGRTVRIVEARGQSTDHPVSLHVPESDYLKCFILEVR